MIEVEREIVKLRKQLEAHFPVLKHWSVSFDNANRRAGICRLGEQRISISKKHVTNNSIDVVRDTILHEFAHAIAYEEYGEKGHGARWKSIAKQIGATPKATGLFNLPEAPWMLVHLCPHSNELAKIAPRFRRNKKIKHYHLRDKPETKGQLFFVSSEAFNAFCEGAKGLDELQLIQ